MLGVQLLGHLRKAIPVKSLINTGTINSLATRGLRHIALEPEYLTSKEAEEDTYEPLNVQIKGFDFTVLEKFSSFIHRTANKMDIEVADCWAAPCKKLKINTFKPQGTQIESTYSLSIYERNVQVVDLPATKAPIFISVIQAALPEGVDMCVKPHTQEDEDVRYVPDIELEQLRAELQALGGPITSKKK